MNIVKILQQRLQITEEIRDQIISVQRFYTLTDDMNFTLIRCKEIVNGYDTNLRSLIYANDYTKNESELKWRREIEEFSKVKASLNKFIQRSNNFIRFGVLCLN